MRLGQLQQFCVGARIPDKEREARRQFQIGQRKLAVFRHALGSLDRAEQEVGAGQNRRYDFGDSLVESAFIQPAFGVEAHQLSDIVLRHGTAIGAMRQVLRDLLGACLLANLLGVANENQRSAGAVRDSGRVVGTLDLQRDVLGVRQARHRRAASAAEAPAAPDVVVRFHMRTVDEANHNRVRAGLHFDRDLLEAVQDLLPTHVALDVRESQILGATNVALELHLAVDHQH